MGMRNFVTMFFMITLSTLAASVFPRGASNIATGTEMWARTIQFTGSVPTDGSSTYSVVTSSDLPSKWESRIPFDVPVERDGFITSSKDRAEMTLNFRGASSQHGQPSTSESFRDQQQKYEAKVRSELDQLNTQIAGLKVKAAKQSAKARSQINRDIRDLNRKSEVARRKLQRLEASSQSAWKDMKAGMDAAMEDLKASYQRASSQFN